MVVAKVTFRKQKRIFNAYVILKFLKIEHLLSITTGLSLSEVPTQASDVRLVNISISLSMHDRIISLEKWRKKGYSSIYKINKDTVQPFVVILTISSAIVTFPFLTTFRGRPFNFWGGGVGDFENKFLQTLVGRKKLHAAQIEYKKFMHCCEKEKKCYQFISSFRKLYKNYPSKTATILPLFPFKLWNGGAAELLLHVS